MSHEAQWSRTRTVLEAALELPPEQRSAYVAEACSDDPSLRDRVDSLLASLGDSLIEDQETQALDGVGPARPGPSVDLAGRTLAHYEVLEKIGQGGMGEVYRARDVKLGREVAIKVLPPTFADHPRRLGRFEREARLLAALNHPNIATIHGLEESGGVRFLVLELVDGEGLDQRIARGAVPPAEAGALFAQIAGALEAAHEKGIVHRDLKPANVRINSKGQVKVLDFGLAKALGPVPGEPGTDAVRREMLETRRNVIVGTIAYVSPEQARGLAVDSGSDMWSFGCTLFEALTGHVAFPGDSLVDTISAIIERDPEWELLPQEVPADMRRLLRRCLDKQPQRRLRAAREARSMLETTTGEPVRKSVRLVPSAVALVVALTITALAWMWLGRSGETLDGAAAEPAPTVAVVPLTNLTGDDDLEWMQEGMANLVRDRLAESRHLVVVSRTRWETLQRGAGDPRDLRGLAAAAGIDYVVSGELLPAPDGIMLTARVTDVTGGVDLMARSIQGLTRENLLESTNRLAVLTKQALKIPHTERVEVFAADFAIDHPAAYEAYLVGLEFFLRFSYKKAERAFRSALSLEPDYHAARYRLAHVLAVTGRSEEALAAMAEIPEGAAMSRRERLYVEGARALFARDYETAKHRYRELLEEYPYEVEAREFLAEVHDQEYDDDSAVRELRILADQEPENPSVWVFLGETYLRTGRLDEADDAVQRYLALSPQDAFGFTVVGELNRARGRTEPAARYFERALELDAEFYPAKIGRAVVYALQGDVERAEGLWRELVEDEAAEPRYRVDAALELSYRLRARNSFAESVVPLEQLEPLIREEGVLEAQALAVRGLSHLELGEPDEAARLIDLAIERSPSVPTRYLFARGLLELHRGGVDAVRATAAEIRGHALPPDDPDRTEEKAAAYLEGLAYLAAGDNGTAIASLRESIGLEGYRYALYRLGLALALESAGRHSEAASQAAEAAADRDPADPRFDLDLDRARAASLQADIGAASR